MARKRFTILHSNDLHGDFHAEELDGGFLSGGFALLSGYINKVREEEENVLYVIAGDMLQGSLIDTEYRGIATIDLVNYLSPDVVTLGNHEMDYGLAHLLFLEKLANFPIVNANLYTKHNYRRLMTPALTIEVDGFNFLFTGIITELVLDVLAVRDTLVSTFITLEEAREEVGKIVDAYKLRDTDLTVLLTHIGIESDIELARMLDPAWGVDIIIGGHSHTVLDEPLVENDIIIVTAGIGSDQIGRLDIEVDSETNSVTSYEWELVTVTPDIAEPDQGLAKYLHDMSSEVNAKHATILTHMDHALTHPSRLMETTLGNLIADIFAERADADVALVGSGQMRSPVMGPVVTRGDLLVCIPFDESLIRFEVTGSELLTAFSHWMRKENRNGEGQCYQVSRSVRAVYDDSADELLRLEVHGALVRAEQVYSLALANYHAIHMANYLALDPEVLSARAEPWVAATSFRQVIEEWLRTHQRIEREIEGRLVYRS